MDKLAELEKELLAEMEENPVEYKETVSNVFEIDSNLRTINIPITVKNIGVEADDDVKRLEFTMPKQYGEFDLSQFRIRINYMNANGDKSIYLVEDKTVTGDDITFSWLVGRNVTKYKGQVKFIVCLKLSNEQGQVLKELNTTLCRLEVLEGLEVVPVIDEKTTDIIEQLLRMVETETTGAVQKVTEEGNKQVKEVQKAAQEIAADREQIQKNAESVTALKEELKQFEEYEFLQYDITQYEKKENGLYGSAGNWIENNEYDTYMVKLSNSNQYIMVHSDLTITLFDKKKEFVKTLKTKKLYLNDDNVTSMGYVAEIGFFFCKGMYLAYPSKKTATDGYLRTSPFKNIVPFTEYRKDYADKIIFKNGNIINKDYNTNMGEFKKGTLSLLGQELTEDPEVQRNYCNGIGIYKKGTVIDTTNTAVNFNVRGFNINGNFFVKQTEAKKHYIFKEDSVATVTYEVGPWTWTDNAPIITDLECSYFIRFLLPEEIKKNNWKGKKWYAYGTSITDIGVGDTEGNNGHSGKYPLCIDALSGLIRHNGAIGSGGLLPSAPHGGNVKENILKCPKDAELVTIETLPNDGADTNLGKIGDTGDDTIIGNLTQCFEYLTKNTNARIVLLAVTGLAYQTDGQHYSSTSNWRIAWRKAVEEITKLAKLYGIDVIDADACALEWEKRIKEKTLKDNIHLNYLGGEIFGRYIWEKMKNIEPKE